MSNIKSKLKVNSRNWVPGQDIRNVDLRELMKLALITTGILRVCVFLMFMLYQSNFSNNIVLESLVIIITNFIIYLLVAYKKIAYKYFLPIYIYFVIIPNIYIMNVFLSYIDAVSQRNLYLMMYCGLFVISNIFYFLYDMNKPTNKYFIIVLGMLSVPLTRMNYFIEAFYATTFIYYTVTIYSIYYFHLLRYATKELRKVNK